MFTIPHTPNSYNQKNQSSAGRIKRLVLTQQGRAKLDLKPDREFYAYPRFVTHVDEKFISTLTDLYRERLRPEMEILDLMSSWISHLPEEVKYKKVVGHGLNAQELSKNPRLDYFFVKDLNQDQKLAVENGSFDAVLCTVSVQYLQQPEKCVEGFTEPEIIRRLNTASTDASGGGAKENNSIFSMITGWLGLVSGSDPFYAVITYKNFKPIYK
ncbi:S-adenosyl-L-methionine-dependent methyltransferase superfamily protein [Abeliophyllum distichum]|uniref:S-adenosyl-L-methionine-dependent methyltransferase superfamily protein n=1 Tax=Abeliophyllum distichum TaxID=126358 RepID=A0ABD1SXT8_9LAMI